MVRKAFSWSFYVYGKVLNYKKYENIEETNRKIAARITSANRTDETKKVLDITTYEIESRWEKTLFKKGKDARSEIRKAVLND